MKIIITVLLMLIFSSLIFGKKISNQPDERQFKLFAINCMQCHSNPESGAPIIGDKERWTDIVKRGEEAIFINVVEGIRGMPPLGYCSACSVEDLRVLTRFIANLPRDEGGNK